jgi:hypothetical protein
MSDIVPSKRGKVEEDCVVKRPIAVKKGMKGDEDKTRLEIQTMIVRDGKRNEK